MFIVMESAGILEQKLKDLRQRVLELKAMKEQLELQLQNDSPESTMPINSDPMQQVAETEISDNNMELVCPSEQLQQQLMQKGAELDKIRELEAILCAYKYNGITLSFVKKGHIEVHFHTMFKGQFFDKFCLDIQYKEKNVVLAQHTVPNFIPLSTLLQSYNSHQLKFSEFLRQLHSYLNAYIKRREQLKELTSKYPQYLSEDVLTIGPYNFIQLSLVLPSNNGSQSIVHVHLIYKDLHSTLPTKIRCSNNKQVAIPPQQIKDVFLNQPPLDALESLI